MGVPETSTHDRETEPGFVANLLWKEGVAAGLLAAVASAIAITLLDAGVLAEDVAGLYGLEGSLVAGWIAHLVHGTVFGLIFAVVLTDPMLSAARKTTVRTVVAALVFGLVLAVAGAGVLMPMWLEAVGVASEGTIPRISLALTVWHGIYGLVLGAGFAALDGDGGPETD